MIRMVEVAHFSAISCTTTYVTAWPHCISSSDIDECEISPCDANAICENTEGSYECYCKNGFSGNGFNCSGMFSEIM